MNRKVFTIVLAVFVTTALAGSVSAKTTVTYIGTMGTWYIATDEPVQSYTNMEWVPNTRPDKRDIRIEPEAPGRVSVHQDVERAACWLVDGEDYSDIVWGPVLGKLRVNHGIFIGRPMTCCAIGTADVPECMRVDMSLYVPHERKCFRVEQNGTVALISVMIPMNGLLAVYTNAEPLDYYGCDGPTAFENPNPICASMGPTPAIGQGCLAGGNGDDKLRRRPRIDLVSQPREEATTWGRVKALYQGEN